MGSPLEGCVGRRRREALAELARELERFSPDGLSALADDLAAGRVLRGSWAGCVLSYRAGAPGSTRRDRGGRVRNVFTELWDSGRLTDEEVAEVVRVERTCRSAGSGSAGIASRGRPTAPSGTTIRRLRFAV